MKRVSLRTAATVATCAAFAVLTASQAYAREEAPKSEIAIAQQALDQAQAAGATENAPLELKNARDKLQTAQNIVAKDKSKDFAQARKLAEEATADAELAQARANAAKAQKSLDEVNAATRAMHEEAQRQKS